MTNPNPSPIGMTGFGLIWCARGDSNPHTRYEH